MVVFSFIAGLEGGEKAKAEILILTLLQVGRGELNFRTQNVMFISKVKICLPLHHETLLLS